jgi:sugar fermentation stimulation protein A
VRIGDNLIEGRFVARDNRFRATIEVAGKQEWAHLPNSGRLCELLVPGRRVSLSRQARAGRKTSFDLCLIEMGGRWVSVDARLPNALVAEALSAGQLPEFVGYDSFRREVSYGQSRLDFLLESSEKAACLVEVKSVTLVIDGLACFPDAVTLRGRRHLEELAAAVAAGYRAAVVFVVQRDDVLGLRPHDEADPDFGRTLRQVVDQGVEVHAYGCQVRPAEVRIARSLPVLLDRPGG